MYSIEFEYSMYKGLKVPLIPVGFKGKSRWHELWAFVDSGATYTIFEAKEAELLEIDILAGKKMMIVVGDGSFIPVYFHKVQMKIGDIQFESEIGFSERLGVGFSLLGRKDIFEIFKVCFSDKEKRVSFIKEEVQNT